jgi:hypothetical protein
MDDLMAACHETACVVMGQKHPIRESSVQSLAKEFYAIASKRANDYYNIGEDGEIVNRAVWYLAQVHASSPVRSRIRWFSNMLDALLELALPNTFVADEKPKRFLEDLLKGIRWSIDNAPDRVKG